MSHEIDPEEWEYPIDRGCFEYSDVTVNLIEPVPVVRDLLEDATPTRTVVAGSRTIYNEEVVRDALESAPNQWFDPPTEVIHGGAHGVDTTAEKVVKEDLLADTVVVADYQGKYGTRGPILRNKDMAEYADNLITVWNGISNGTRNMIENALDHGLNVYVHQI